MKMDDTEEDDLLALERFVFLISYAGLEENLLFSAVTFYLQCASLYVHVYY